MLCILGYVCVNWVMFVHIGLCLYILVYVCVYWAMLVLQSNYGLLTNVEASEQVCDIHVCASRELY